MPAMRKSNSMLQAGGLGGLSTPHVHHHDCAAKLDATGGTESKKSGFGNSSSFASDGTGTRSRHAIPEELVEVYQQAAKLPVVLALNSPGKHEIKLADVEELFKVLGQDARGLLPFQKIGHLLQGLLTPPFSDDEVDQVLSYTDRNSNGLLSTHELFAALTAGPIRQLIRHLQRHHFAKTRSDSMIRIDRAFLEERVSWRVDRDDKFSTLPITVVYMIVFMLLVMMHLRIWERQQIQRGLGDWLSVPRDDAVAIEHVKDVDLFYRWFDGRGITDIMGQVENRSDPAGEMTDADEFQVRLASSYLLGDVQLRMGRLDGSYRSVWLLHEPDAVEVLAANPWNFTGAARRTVRGLGPEWSDDQITLLQVEFCTYSERAMLFSTVSIEVPFDDFGHVQPQICCKAIMVDPYPSNFIYAADAFYVLLMLYIIMEEGKDMFAAIRLGFKEFVDYWDLYNVVDWLSIFLGIVNAGIWVSIISAMQAQSLQAVLVRDNLAPDVMRPLERDAGSMEDIRDDVKVIVERVFALHFSMMVSIVVIMLRFFKSFQANPRLEVVTKTLVNAAEDIFHFFLVFATIFVSFAVSGHVLFGTDLPMFNTIATSLRTSGTTLLGEFTWYSELDANDEFEELLPSGIPRIFVTVWFVFFMVFVLLVLLNMLLAVIFERYSVESENLKMQAGGDDESDEQGVLKVDTFFTQAHKYVVQKWEMSDRTFIPLFKIRRDLENDKHPAHPDPGVVTAESLKSSFAGMTDKQAEWLMTWLDRELKRKQHEEFHTEGEDLGRIVKVAKQNEGYMKSVAEELRLVALQISNCHARIDDLRKELSAARAADGDLSARSLEAKADAAGRTASRGTGSTDKSAALAREMTESREKIRLLSDAIRRLVETQDGLPSARAASAVQIMQNALRRDSLQLMSNSRTRDR